jgi:C-terminal processing protease CtpA/Prc
MKGSPAEKAGFQPGDVILAMNSNFSRNIQTYKSLLQNVGEKIRVLVLREGSPQMITLKVGSILKRKGF